MKTKKMLYFLIVSIFVLCTLSISIYASSFSYTFGTRGTAADETNKYEMTGENCTMSANTLKVTVDKNTSARSISYKMQYWTPGLLGFAGMVDEEILLNNVSIGNTGTTGKTLCYDISEKTFSDTSVGANDKGSIKGFAQGATNAYYFEINNAQFTFWD